LRALADQKQFHLRQTRRSLEEDVQTLDPIEAGKRSDYDCPVRGAHRRRPEIRHAIVNREDASWRQADSLLDLAGGPPTDCDVSREPLRRLPLEPLRQAAPGGERKLLDRDDPHPGNRDSGSERVLGVGSGTEVRVEHVRLCAGDLSPEAQKPAQRKLRGHARYDDHAGSRTRRGHPRADLLIDTHDGDA
jgi:hypothetical protein